MSEHVISEKKIKELFDAADGKRSHFLFLNDEPIEFVKMLEKEDYIVYVKNSSNRPMYRITLKTFEMFAEVDEDTKKQLAWAKAMEDEDAREAAMEEERATAALENKPTEL